MDNRSPFKRSALAGAILAVLASAPAGAAVLTPLTALDTPEQQANTGTLGAFKPLVAADADGDYVVVWTTPPTITDHCDITARKYNSDGTPATAEVTVGTVQGTGCYTRPDVAMDADGDFVVAWTDWVSPTFNIMAQRFDNTATAQGSVIAVATSTATESNARVAIDADGDFAVAWQEWSSDNNLLLQRYDRNGTKQGVAQPLHAPSTLNQTFPDIAMDADGDLVAVWIDNSNALKACQFPAGAPAGSEFFVTTTTTYAIQPRIAADADGDFVISWKDSATGQLMVKGYDKSGSESIAPFSVTTMDAAAVADLAMDADGDFAVSWGYWDFLAVPAVTNNYVRRFDRLGTLAGGNQVNSSVDGGESSTSLAMDADGDIIVTWAPDYTNIDGNTYFRRYQGLEDIDLALTTSANPDPVPAGGTLTYTATVTNNHAIVAGTTASQDLYLGAAGAATSVTLSDTLPSGTSYLSASGTGWSCSEASGTVSCDLAGGLLPTASSSLDIRVTAPATGTTLSNSASVAASQLDATTANNSDALDTALCSDFGTLALSAATATVAENGTSVTLTVSRSGGSCGAVSVDYATADGTAIAGEDYTAASGTLSWSNGDSADKSITVDITDDTAVEGDEAFTLTLSGATGATLGSSSEASVTISDDESALPIIIPTSGGGGGALNPWWLALAGVPLWRRRRR